MWVKKEVRHAVVGGRKTERYHRNGWIVWWKRTGRGGWMEGRLWRWSAFPARTGGPGREVEKKKPTMEAVERPRSRYPPKSDMGRNISLQYKEEPITTITKHTSRLFWIHYTTCIILARGENYDSTFVLFFFVCLVVEDRFEYWPVVLVDDLGSGSYQLCVRVFLLNSFLLSILILHFLWFLLLLFLLIHLDIDLFIHKDHFGRHRSHRCVVTF